MKLGTETNSLVNHMMSGGNQPEPVEGMACTVLAWTDRYAATVVVAGTAAIKVQEDKATRTDSNGISDAQSYTYERNRAGRTWWFKRDKKGQWREAFYEPRTKRWRFVGGFGLLLGRRENYHDPDL